MSFKKSDLLFLGDRREIKGKLFVSFPSPGSANLLILREVLALFGAEVERCVQEVKYAGHFVGCFTDLPFSEVEKLNPHDSFPTMQKNIDAVEEEERKKKEEIEIRKQAEQEIEDQKRREREAVLQVEYDKHDAVRFAQREREEANRKQAEAERVGRQKKAIAELNAKVADIKKRRAVKEQV